MSQHTDDASLHPSTPALPTGVGVALVTVFSSGDEPDLAATAARARACVDLGVTSVLVAGTTGEAQRLSAGDRLRLAEAVRGAAGEVPVIVGTGDPDAGRALDTTGKVAAAGAADALLVYAPRGSDPEAFFGKVLDEAGAVPVLAYHNPGLAPAAPIEPTVVPGLGVAGMKDSSGSTNRLAELVEAGVELYVGSVTQVLLAGACGARGALLAAANVAPSLCIAAWNGEAAAQRALFGVHLRCAAGGFGFLKSVPPDGFAAQGT